MAARPPAASDRQVIEEARPKCEAPPRWIVALYAVGLFLVVAGARTWLVGRYGSDVPFWDQWDAEGAFLYLPYLDGSLSLRALFAAWHEHRILFSRLLALALLLSNGQWDARLQMLVNSLLYSLVPCFLFVLLARSRGRIFAAAWTVVLALVFALPFGWENTLAGFQSSIYFLVALSMGSMSILVNGAAGSPTWWVGLGLAFASLFSMGSGVMAAAAVLGFTLAAATRARSVAGLREWGPTAVAAGSLVALALLLSVTEARHASLRAHGPMEFLSALAYGAAWPVRWSPWACINWLPCGLLGVGYVSRHVPDGRAERSALVLGLWVLLQMSAVALLRAWGASASRYTDLLALGLLANFLAAWSLLASGGAARRVGLVLFCVWIGGAAYGLGTSGSLAEAASRKRSYDVETYNVAGYVATGDVRFLSAAQNRLDVPYPDAARLRTLLDTPELRAILPAGIRLPVDVRPEPPGTPLHRRPSVPDLQPPHPWERL